MFLRRGDLGWARRSKLVTSAIVGLALLALDRSAAAVPSECEAAERFRLNNGIEVVLQPDHALPAVAVLSSVHVGRRNDPPGHADMTHYIEHLTFRTGAGLAAPDDLYRRLGALDMNATTSFDTTDYFAVVPSTHLEQALWIEARRLAVGLDTVSPTAAQQERQVLQREFILRFDRTPHLRLWGVIGDSFFPAGHPYRALPASVSSIGELTLPDARWFFARYYRPERIRIVLVGDFEPAPVHALLDTLFGTLVARNAASPANSPVPFDTTPEEECRWTNRPPERTHSRVVLKTRSRSEGLAYFWAFPANEDAERWRPMLETFADGVRSVMHQAALASGVRVSLLRTELGSFWYLGIEVTPGRELSQVESLVRKLFAEALENRHDAKQAAAQRQAVETSARLEHKTLLSRAQRLALHWCQPAQCTGQQEALVDFEQLKRFDLNNALVVEMRFEPKVAPDGAIEVLQ